MKKIASILTLFVGLILLALNYHVTAYSSNSDTSNSSFHSKQPVKKTDTEDKTFDVSNINLPSIFDALIRSL